MGCWCHWSRDAVWELLAYILAAATTRCLYKRIPWIFRKTLRVIMLDSYVIRQKYTMHLKEFWSKLVRIKAFSAFKEVGFGNWKFSSIRNPARRSFEAKGLPRFPYLAPPPHRVYLLFPDPRFISLHSIYHKQTFYYVFCISIYLFTCSWAFFPQKVSFLKAGLVFFCSPQNLWNLEHAWYLIGS